MARADRPRRLGTRVRLPGRRSRWRSTGPLVPLVAEHTRHGRDESEDERADRRWNETLQEVRVVQTGAQIMFGFLLSVAFTARFERLGDFDKALYATAVILGAVTTGVLVGTVALHVTVSGHHIKPRLIRVTGWVVPLGLALLGCTVACALLLLLRVALDDTVAAVATGVVAAWFVAWWFLLPMAVLHRHGRKGDEAGGRTARRPPRS